MRPGRYESSNVCHINHEDCANLISYLSEFGKVDCSGVGGRSGHYNFGSVLFSEDLYFLVVNIFAFSINPLRYEIV